MLRARRAREAADATATATHGNNGASSGGKRSADADPAAQQRAVKRKKTLGSTVPVEGEEELAARLFGRVDDVVHSLTDAARGETDNDDETTRESTELHFVLDKEGTAASEGAATAEVAEAEQRRAPAWVDDDDGALNVDIAGERRLRKLRKTEDEEEIDGADYEARLRSQFERIHGRPQWAAHADEQRDKKKKKQKKAKDSGSRAGGEGEGADGEGEDGDADADADAIEEEAGAILRRAGPLLSRHPTRLPSGRLRVTRVQDLNAGAPSDAAVQAVRFHPTAPVAFTAGLDKTLRLFALDGKNNPKIQSVFIPDLPIHEARFTPDGRHIVCSGRRPFFYLYDIEGAAIRKIPNIRGRTERSLERFVVAPDGRHLCFTGEDGALLLVSMHTKQWVATLKMNGTARGVTFSADGKQLMSTGGDGQVYLWDVETRRCVHRFTDDGSTGSISIAASHGGKLFATGSSAGVVNLYDAAALIVPTPRPIKAFMNLTTTIDQVEFNWDDQILGFSSQYKKDAFRVAHVPSLSVFANWPTASTPIHYANSFAFSPHGGFASIGNDRGKALLYRVNHYDSY
eukprot:Opistho-2@79493